MNGPKKHMAEEMIGRFRSKEDLYRYILSKVRHVSVNSSSCSERLPSFHEGHKAQLPQGHPRR